SQWITTLQELETDADVWPQLVPSDTKSAAIREYCKMTGNETCAVSCCAVCGENQQQSSTRQISSAKFAAKYSALVCPWEEIQSLFNAHPELLDYECGDLNSTVVLEPSGLVTTDEGETVVQVCGKCYAYLQRKKTPARSLANGRWNGVSFCPEELLTLTVPERMLISLYRSRVKLIRLGFANSPEEQKLALQGHVISFPQDPGPAVRALPRPVTELGSTVRIVFVGSTLPTHEVIYRYTVVRKAKVLAAINWLKTYNYLWRDIQVNPQTLADLPDEGVPCHIKPSAVDAPELVRLIAADRSGYAKGTLAVN
ncbi:MAG: DUF6570 domain-containing protein, partial [Bacteroidota bacterium]